MSDNNEDAAPFGLADPLAKSREVQATKITRASVVYIGDPDDIAGDGTDHKPKVWAFGRWFKMGEAAIVTDGHLIRKFLGNRFFKVEEAKEDGGATGDGSGSGGEGSPKAGSGNRSGGKSSG